VLVLGCVLVAAAAVGGIVLLIAGSGGGSSSDVSASRPSPGTAELQRRFLGRVVVDADRGIAVRRPEGWSIIKRAGAVTLSSHNHCLAMTLSSPAPADGAKRLRSDSLALFRHTYADAKVQPAPSSPVGGIPTASNTVRFNERGRPVEAVLSVGTGKRNSYLTEIVVRSPSCQNDLRLAQLSLSSIRYTK
jgi:hypothetical protein